MFVGDVRLLSVTNVVCLFCFVFYKLWLSSVDVIHSWTVGSLGCKVDCVPGRANELSIVVHANGSYYGQCSELCGVLHGFMPIHLVVQ